MNWISEILEQYILNRGRKERERSRGELSSPSSILPNKMEPSASLSHPLAFASKLMSSLQHYTVQTLIPVRVAPPCRSSTLAPLSARSTLETSIKSYISVRRDRQERRRESEIIAEYERRSEREKRGRERGREKVKEDQRGVAYPSYHQS